MPLTITLSDNFLARNESLLNDLNAGLVNLTALKKHLSQLQPGKPVAVRKVERVKKLEGYYKSFVKQTA